MMMLFNGVFDDYEKNYRQIVKKGRFFFIIIYISFKDFFYKFEVYLFQEIEVYVYLYENIIIICGFDFVISVSVSNCGKVDLIG